MKTTLEIPGDLFKRTKVAAALRGTSMKDLVIEALEEKLDRRVVRTPGWRAVFGRAPAAAVLDVDGHLQDLERINPEEWK